jgi:hypothetical protein
MSTPPDTTKNVPSSPASSQLPSAETSKESDDKDAPDSTKAPETYGGNDKDKEQEVDTATSDIFSPQFDSEAWNMDGDFMITDDIVRDMLSESRPRNFEDLIATSGSAFPTDLDTDHFLSYGSIMLDVSNVLPPSST